jgi:chromodomain-helicase-DNA-binding protein 4
MSHKILLGVQGKTVQIAAFLGNIIKQWDAWPVLIVVPNSTITNWVRELSKWAPALRVVAYYGQSKGRAIVKKYELYHEVIERGTTGCKFHVVVTTYDTATNAKDSATVFQTVPRWEVLIVDEGQRRKHFRILIVYSIFLCMLPLVKNDRSLLFKKLNKLNCMHRIIMTGVSDAFSNFTTILI